MHTGDKQHQKLLAEASKHDGSSWATIVACKTCFRHTAHKSYGFHPNPHNLLLHLVSAHGYKPKHWWQIWR